MLAGNMPATNQSQLPLVSEKHFPHGNAPAAADLVAYCDQHDLVAIATEAHDVVVYRITGHPAFTIKRRNGDAEVTALKWKPSEPVLAVGWNDGAYTLHSGENGRLLSQGSVRGTGSERGWKLDLAPDYDDDGDEEGGPIVTRFSWEVHLANVSESGPVGAAGDIPGYSTTAGVPSTEDWFDDTADDLGEPKSNRCVAGDDERSAIKLLTNGIANIDVTSSMPRLSAIPAHGLKAGLEGSKFASQAGTDAVFGGKGNNMTNVDALIVCGSDGTVQVLQDDEVKVGSCHLDGSESGGGKAVMCAASQDSASHAILTRDTEGGLNGSFIDIPIDDLGSALLHVIATNTKRINNLLTYITQTVRCIQHDYTTGLHFPTRLLNNANAELSEKEEGDIITNLYHLAMTTDLSPTMLEWLVDIVKETNHKRWDQAINAMYTNIQNHLFINLLPALDRLSVATTTLRGHARFYEGTSEFEVAPQRFTNLLEGIDGLRLVAHKMQLIIMTEHRQFRAFSKWLRVMIEIGVAGPGSKGANEAEEREVPNFDFPLLLAYIKNTMTKSQLVGHVTQIDTLKGTCEGVDAFFAQSVMAEMGYEKIKDALRGLNEVKKFEELQVNDGDSIDGLLNIPAITAYLAANVRVAMESITAWQGKMLTKPTSLLVEVESGVEVLDMQMIIDKDASPNWSNTRLLMLPVEARQQLIVYPITYTSMSKAARKATPEEPTIIDLPFEVLDAKFYGQHLLVIARDGTGQCSINSIILPTAQETAEGRGVMIRFAQSFLADSGFLPESLVIGGRPGRMVCLVLGNGGREWRALDLDANNAVGSGAEEMADFDMTDDSMVTE